MKPSSAALKKVCTITKRVRLEAEAEDLKREERKGESGNEEMRGSEGQTIWLGT